MNPTTIQPPPAPVQLPPPAPQLPVLFMPGGIAFRDAKSFLATVVDNGICSDDPRVMTRTNEATKIILDNMIPVGGMATFNVAAIDEILYLPPELENVIEAFPVDAATKVRGQTDIQQGWYEIVNNSAYLDPNQHHDNPLIDEGLWPDASDPSTLRRVYRFPGLQPSNAVVNVTGAKRYVPIKTNDDFLIVQNLEALKLIILSIERNENSAPDDAPKYKQQAMELLQAEVKKHILDPRNYMRRKSNYYDDLVSFAEHTMGWMRAITALDMDEALRRGKIDLLWELNQVEHDFMMRGIWKDTVQFIQAQVVGGMIYFPINVGSIMAMDLNGLPIPIRSQFFQHLDNGPGMFPCNEMLIDQGDTFFPGSQQMRRKYKLIANCNEGACISAVIKLRWLYKRPHDLMVIKNYPALRAGMLARFRTDKDDVQGAAAARQESIDILQQELQDYLRGIKHTIQVQTFGFGLGDVGNYWVR